MTEIPGLHPLVVHFPIVLLPVALVLDLLSVTLSRRDFSVAATWALWAGTLAAAFAVYTGHEAAELVGAGLDAQTSATVATHHDLAIVALVAASVLSAWRIVFPKWRSLRGRVLFLLLLGALVANLAVGAHLGGQLVFREGVGVRGDGCHMPAARGT